MWYMSMYRPMNYETTLALVTLAELPRVGERRLSRVQAVARGQPRPALPYHRSGPEHPGARLRFTRRRIAQTPARGLLAFGTLRSAALTPLGLWRAGGQPGDSSYPKRWLERGDPAPPLAYLYGAAQLLDAPCVALLASRGVGEQMVSATVHIAQRAAREDFALVVGGMKSTHRIAAVTGSGGRRTAHLVVLDRGLFAAFGGQPEFDPFGFGPDARASIRARRWCCRCSAPTITPRRAAGGAATS